MYFLEGLFRNRFMVLCVYISIHREWILQITLTLCKFYKTERPMSKITYERVYVYMCPCVGSQNSLQSIYFCNMKKQDIITM